MDLLWLIWYRVELDGILARGATQYNSTKVIRGGNLYPLLTNWESIAQILRGWLQKDEHSGVKIVDIAIYFSTLYLW